MKNFFILLFAFCATTSIGKNATLQKLTEVNKCWMEQKDIVPQQLPGYTSLSEQEWIRLHLSQVEKILRSRNTEALTIVQKKNRASCLNDLHDYWLAGKFPVNEYRSYRTPVFIDKYDNFCAVGYLVKASGHEKISRLIASRTNFAYVREMKYPELFAWAHEHGFTVDELAWIQPGYPSQMQSGKIGDGVDGEVNELFADADAGRLFVGGSFTNVDGSVVANNIAYVTQTGTAYMWHSMGGGVNGAVNAITKYDGKIFVAGSFTAADGNPVSNVASWDGSAWHSVGCIGGVVNDLIVFNGDLYAAGSFDVCTIVPFVNFAKWNGSMWLPIPGLIGHINTMEVMDTMLLLGGAFAYSSADVNAIRWNANTSFQPFTDAVNNEVKDFEIFGDTLYAACRHTHPTDSENLFLKLRDNTWYGVFGGPLTGFYARDGQLDFNTLCVEPGSLNFGGQFNFAPMIGTSAANCYNLLAPGYYNYGNWVYVDSEVNKMVMFNNSLIIGGKFKSGSNYSDFSSAPITLNGIARRREESLLVPEVIHAGTLTAYPDPVTAASSITVDNSFNADRFTILDINGAKMASGILSHNRVQQLALPQLAPGMYMLEAHNLNGEKAIKKFTVK